MGQIKFGVIGCGNAAYFHMLPFKSLPNANLKFVAAYDVNEKSANQIGKTMKVTPYTDIDKLLKSDLDAVLILVPHYLHASMVKKVAEAGKHVLCEKPMAPTLEECDEMIAATKKANVQFMITENHRFLPAHQLMKKFIQEGYIGDVFLGRSYEGAFCRHEEFTDPNLWHFTFDKGGGGVLADQGVHKFSMLNWFFGEVDFVQAWLSKVLPSPPTKGEDNAMILMKYKCGAMIEVDITSTSVHPLTNRTELHGTKGSILEDHSWPSPIQLFSSHPNAEKKGEFYAPVVEHGVYPKYYTIAARVEDTYFADCILNNQKPEFTPEQAKEGVAVVLCAYLSAKKGSPVTMAELRKIAEAKKTKTILEGLQPFIQQNQSLIKWN
jgi:predicted dehydrogenase